MTPTEAAQAPAGDVVLDDDLLRDDTLALDINGNPDVADTVTDEARFANARATVYDAAASGSPIALAIERAHDDRNEYDAALNVLRSAQTHEPDADQDV